ncbi:unnamed protein product [Mytilus coruscus]|uniref:B box-type domain-containing protein n=1 Tax=Mytilus coruscus TaxID=42192 RepID=A0A6J8C462_MYTCO|nr:unnamed protein product [Mytilus coruscus]
MTHNSLCAICDLRHLTVSSTHWCQECEEALCIDCKEHHTMSKASKSHNVMLLSVYSSLPSSITNIELLCTYHNEKYLQYCVKHECPICYKCINEHGKCGELILFEVVVNDVKASELFRDMEQSLSDLIVNINQIKKDRESNIDMIKNKRKYVIEEVTHMRNQINQHLDNMQYVLMKELDKVENECCEKIQLLVSSLNDIYNAISQCNTEIENMKKYASDIQMFLGMREIQKKIIINEKCVHSMIENMEIMKVDIDYVVDGTLPDFLTNTKPFGSIAVTSSPSDGSDLVSSKEKQAQILELEISCNEITGCCVTVRGGYLFIDYDGGNEKIQALHADGESHYNIPLSRRYSSFDLVCIDDKTVAITTGYSSEKTCVMVIDLTNRKVKRSVDLPTQPFGICFNGNSLICCCYNMDMHVISCKDFSITKIPNTSTSEYSYITSHAGKIFFTDPDKNQVNCCLYSGVQVWEFKNEFILRNPRGITVDHKGNIFVVGMESQNIVVISSDGKQFKEIEMDQLNLSQPSSIFFDKIRKQVLVSDQDSVANLYNISYI